MVRYEKFKVNKYITKEEFYDKYDGFVASILNDNGFNTYQSAVDEEVSFYFAEAENGNVIVIEERPAMFPDKDFIQFEYRTDEYAPKPGFSIGQFIRAITSEKYSIAYSYADPVKAGDINEYIGIKD